MAVPDFSGITNLSQNTIDQFYAAIRNAGLNSAWESAVHGLGKDKAWDDSMSSKSINLFNQALGNLGWSLGGAGSGGGGDAGGGTTGTTPTPNPAADALLGNSLSALGIGAVAGGPNYKISSPFRHLFGQDQIDQFAVKDPASLYKMGSDGKIQQAKFDWWRPNATVGSFGAIPLPSTSSSTSSSSGSNNNND